LVIKGDEEGSNLRREKLEEKKRQKLYLRKIEICVTVRRRGYTHFFVV
jgi:hypothetical protein